MLLGTLPHSGRIRGVLAEHMDQAHLIEAMDKVMRRLGGTAHVWRTDRLASVIVPGTADVQASFAPVAKHYGAIVEPCPPRRGNRKGSVESSVRFCSGRWWRTLSAKDPESAQISLDRFLAGTGDARPRRSSDGTRTTVGALADAEPLMALPWAPYPGHHLRRAHRGRQRHGGVSGQPLFGAAGTDGLGVRGETAAVHPDPRDPQPLGRPAGSPRPGAAGIGDPARLPEHHAALEAAVLGAFTTARPCDRKANRPPGPEALAEAARLLGTDGRDVVVDLAAYAALVEVTA